MTRARKSPAQGPGSDRCQADRDSHKRTCKGRVTPDRRGYRPPPADFAEKFVQLGWSDELKEHFRAGWGTIIRWVQEAGGEQLRAQRRNLTGSAPKPWLRRENQRRKRYVLGQTLSRREAGHG